MHKGRQILDRVERPSNIQLETFGNAVYKALHSKWLKGVSEVCIPMIQFHCSFSNTI
jgi:hypothetical protein